MIRVSLFGQTKVVAEAGTFAANELGGSKPRQILEILAAAGGAPVAKEQLAEMLWEGNPPKTYLGTLESYVCVLRRTLGLGGGRKSILATTPHGYVLDPERVEVDLHRVRDLLARANRAEGMAAVELVERALGLVTGPLFGLESYAAWAEAERTRTARQLAGASVRAAGLALAAGQGAVAVRLAASAVERDRYDETAVEHLMRALWQTGRRCEAMRAYASLRALTVEEFGMEPGEGCQQLYMEILRDDDEAATEWRGRSEVRLLLRLLRQAMEGAPTVETTVNDGALLALARDYVEVA